MTLTLGEFVRARRLTLGLTQTELGEQIGRDQTWVSNLERNHFKELPDPTIIRALARALDVTVADIWTALGYLDPDEEPEGRYHPDVRVFAAIATEIERLSDDVPEHLKEALRADLQYVKERWEQERETHRARTRTRS